MHGAPAGPGGLPQHPTGPLPAQPFPGAQGAPRPMMPGQMPMGPGGPMGIGGGPIGVGGAPGGKIAPNMPQAGPQAPQIPFNKFLQVNLFKNARIFIF